MLSGTWHVGAILREPLADTLKFAAWHLEAGADTVTLLFDDPDDPAILRMAGEPRVRAIPCTAAFWAGLGLSPEARFTLRQNAGLTWLYHRTESGWLLNADGDEFLLADAGGGAMSERLAAVPDDMPAVRVRTAEAIITVAPADLRPFRRPMAYEQRARVYGDDVALFGPRRQGLIGHADGKSLVRAGLAGISLRQHWAVDADGTELRSVEMDATTGVFLLHFVGADYEVWREKLPWRMRSRGLTPKLTRRVEAILSGPDPEAGLRDLHRRLHMADPALLQRMRDEDVLVERAVDLDGPPRRIFGSMSGGAVPAEAVSPSP